MKDAELLAKMRELGVTWKRGHVPHYPGSMTQAQRDRADALYDRMSRAFVDSMTSGKVASKGTRG